jgi:hypothetical protein
VRLGAAHRYLDRTMRTGTQYELRVRARDVAGNIGAWRSAAAFTTRVTQDTSTTLVRSGRWRTSAYSAWSKGSAVYAKADGTRISRTFAGRAVAWVAAIGSTRGSARVLIDGVSVGTVNLHAATLRYRRIVFARSWATSGTHTITIVVSGTSGHPRVDLDALVVIR